MSCCHLNLKVPVGCKYIFCAKTCFEVSDLFQVCRHLEQQVPVCFSNAIKAIMNEKSSDAEKYGKEHKET